jgi:hypothetical protein
MTSPQARSLRFSGGPSSMRVSDARSWLIRASLLLAAATLGFFLAAPVAGYPITQKQGFSLIQLVFPVFAGYVGSAGFLLFRYARRPAKGEAAEEAREVPNLGLLVRWPIYLWAGLFALFIFLFGFTNRAAAPVGDGWSVEDLGMAITAALSLLSVTTNVVIAYLFDAS